MRMMASILGGIFMISLAGCTCPPKAIDVTQEGTYTHGPWCYECSITGKGSRSQGTLGTLCYNEAPVPIPENTDDYYDTPLGQFVYMGMPPGTEEHPIRPWDDKGWMPMASPAGQPLPTPGTQEALVMQAGQMMRSIAQALAASGIDPEEPLTQPEDGPQEKVDVSKDPWDTDFKITPDMRGGEGGGMVFRWVVVSAGPDRAFDTADDLERHSNFIQSSITAAPLNDPGMDMLEDSTTMEPDPVAP